MKARYFTGNRKGIAPVYKTIELAIRSWIFPCILKLVSIKDTFHAYIWRNGRVHFGIDILGEIGIPVVAVEDGVVVVDIAKFAVAGYCCADSASFL